MACPFPEFAMGYCGYPNILLGRRQSKSVNEINYFISSDETKPGKSNAFIDMLVRNFTRFDYPSITPLATTRST
jgi:hypothetical protein